MTDTTTTHTLAKNYAQAIGAGDLEQILGYYSPDIVLEDTWEARAYRGIDEVRAFLAPRIDALHPHWLVDSIVASDEGFAISWVVGGFNEGSLEGHPPTGKPYTCAGASIIAVHDGVIVRSRDFWNRHALLTQLGLPL